MSRTWTLDLDRSARGVLARVHGGTGNERGWASAVVGAFPNGDGVTLPVGTVVRLRAGMDDLRVGKATTEDGTDVLGVVVGTFGGGETFTASDPGPLDMVAVMTRGVCAVLVGAPVTRGQYASVHATDGAAKSSAAPGAGAFGRFIDSAASGTARVSLGVFSAGSGGGGASDLADLGDVSLTGPTSTDVLTFDGAAWVDDARLWRPLMDGHGNVVTDPGSGEAIMALGPR